MKLSVVTRNEQFNSEQQNQLAQIQRQMRQLCLTAISFGKVAYSYDRTYLMVLINDLHRRMVPIVEQNLSEKSAQRLDMVFENIAKVISYSYFVICRFIAQDLHPQTA